VTTALNSEARLLDRIRIGEQMTNHPFKAGTEIGASLARIELCSTDPTALASFYKSTFRLAVTQQASGSLLCEAPGRRLVIRPGRAAQLHEAAFIFATRELFDRHQQRVSDAALTVLDSSDEEFAVEDPEGRRLRFMAPDITSSHVAPAHSDHGPRARLQHLGVRTPTPRLLADFYIERLGFVLSDEVRDVEGDVTAVFLRTDREHHSLALFRAPMIRLDHFSCEADGWSELRDWADHMARVGVDLAWGIGRHGPGNDNFLMIEDPDGNMGEVSSDLEVCVVDRPAGVWPHRPQTLNQWGVAIMRS